MVNFEGSVKICDFGIAKAESKLDNTQAGTLKGKYGYMSPEQVDGLELGLSYRYFFDGNRACGSCLPMNGSSMPRTS